MVPHLLSRTKKILLVLLVFFVVAFSGLAVLIHSQAEAYAVGEAKKQALNALLVHRAIHTYVTQIQRPEIYRLKDEKRLYSEYFSPLVMSFTFISRNIKDLLNIQRQQHDLEPIYFKLASMNPRNPINQADELEARLLLRMNREGLQEYQDVVELADGRYLYLAVPIERSNPGCMKCHGDPADAPRELIALYGDKAGFHEDPTSIRALISIRAPLSGVLAEAGRMANRLTLVTLLVLAGIYALIAGFMLRVDAYQRRVMLQNDDLSRLSVTDALTGTVNRLGLRERLDETIGRSRRFGHPMSALLLDLDHFKQINDRYGHPVGDAVLMRFVEIIQQHIRVSDILGRWGGEEFLILSPHLNLDSARSLAEKLRSAIEQAAFEHGIRLTTSIGVAELGTGETATELVERVDRALYMAKEAGRNRVAA